MNRTPSAEGNENTHVYSNGSTEIYTTSVSRLLLYHLTAEIASTCTADDVYE